MNDKNKTNCLISRKADAERAGGQTNIDKQHAKGKMTAQERVEKLLDPGSFVEIGLHVSHRAVGFGLEHKQYPTDGVITGWGKIDNRKVYVFAQDFTILGGSLGEAHGLKIAHLMELAYQNGAPIIGLNDSGGARIQEGVDSLAAYGKIFYQNTRASGVIPQISLILGPCAGGAVYSPGINDFVFMLESKAFMFITGPDVIKAVTHQEVSFAALGGAKTHSEKSGNVHFTAPDEETMFNQLRLLLSYLPPNNLTPPPVIQSDDDPNRLIPEFDTMVPDEPNQPYDMLSVITKIVDHGEFMEVQPNYAQNIIVGFGRLAGAPVGFVANQPGVLAGVLDINASDKAARFIRFCDAFHIPLVTLVDTPGFLPGVDQEYGGIIRHGAKMIYAYAEATVPKLSIILRKAYGGAYIVMSSKHLQGDYNLAWPQAEIAVMGPEGAVSIVFRKEIKAAEDPQAYVNEQTKRYREEFANPYLAAARGYIDDVILPGESRLRLIQALENFQEKRQTVPPRKHGNIPL